MPVCDGKFENILEKSSFLTSKKRKINGRVLLFAIVQSWLVALWIRDLLSNRKGEGSISIFNRINTVFLLTKNGAYR